MWVGLVVIGALFLAVAAVLVGLALHSQRVEVALLADPTSRAAGRERPASAVWSRRVLLAIGAAVAVVLGVSALSAAVYALPA